MEYTTACECGQVLKVNAMQAGTQVTCFCGRQVAVPLLSELRRSAGRGAYEAGTIDTIARMTNAGELPTGDVCAVSGLPTKGAFNLYIQCESMSLNETGRANVIVLALSLLSFPLWTVWIAMSGRGRREEPEVVGYDRFVIAPLRVHPDHQAKLRQASERQLRKMLGTVPIYAKLLEEFPRAKISTTELR